MILHEFHNELGAIFGDLNGEEIVLSYGDSVSEYRALREAAGVLDLSFRSRLCLTGGDRQRFLNGQVTNNVGALKTGEGCYAALISAKGKMLSDLDIFILENEILLDFEPGLAVPVSERLEKYIIADDVQMVDVAPHYGLLSVQGPKSRQVVERLELDIALPEKRMTFALKSDATLGEIYVANQPRCAGTGFDLFVPIAALGAVADKLIAAVKTEGGRACGWQALETVRIEAGIPRFGADMGESNLPPEAGIESRAVSYTKGCYIGQEVIARIRTYGQVAKALRGLRLSDDLKQLPRKGDKLFREEKEVGYITSAVHSPALKANIALGYVRRECNDLGMMLRLNTEAGDVLARIVELPFQSE